MQVSRRFLAGTDRWRISAATAFAAKLYEKLGGRATLAGATAWARRGLLNAPNEAMRPNWHLARLWLGPIGGGPLVGGNRRRAMMPATHGQKEFLVKARQQVPVASHEMFVGRRRELQKALRALRGEEYAGVLLHGMGRLGKSSLAARIANRRRDLRLAVVFERYGALDVMNALLEALKDAPKAREAVEMAINVVRQAPDRLEGALTDLLCGPCGQEEKNGTPVLLVIDDLERVLEADPMGGRHRVRAAEAAVLGAVLRAFEKAVSHGASRVLLTSRFSFALYRAEEVLYELQLPPMSDTAQRKLELRQREAATDAGLKGAAFAERSALLKRIPDVARGNPGLQDLVGSKVVLAPLVPVDRAKRVWTRWRAGSTRAICPPTPRCASFWKT